MRAISIDIMARIGAPPSRTEFLVVYTPKKADAA
jgi:hypothetical protein